MDAREQPRGVVVLYNHTDQLIKGDPKDLLADQGVIACAHAVEDALKSANVPAALAPITGNVEDALKPFPPTEWLIFNLGEGLAGRLFEEIRIAWAIEAMGYTFTGSDAAALALSTHKARAKEALVHAGVSTPAWRLFRRPEEVTEESLRGLPMPLIVKPVAEDASQGIGTDAVVHNLEQMRKRVAYLVDSYRQAALAEEFIAGREFNISVWGNPPVLLPIAEISFAAFNNPHEKIVSFSAKWEENSFEYQNTPVICPARVDPVLERRIKRTALKAWEAIACRGYARVDMRVSAADIPYVIEVNCNPDISPDAGFFRAAKTAGFSYQDMVLHIIRLGWEHAYTYDRTSVAKRWRTYPPNHETLRRLHPGGSRVRGGTVDRLPSAG